MLNNYIKVTYRNLLKYKFYTLINILGLSVGIACVVFIALFVTTELGYDTYNKHMDRIYRVGVKGSITGEQLNQAVTCAPMAKAIANEVPHVEKVTRIARFGDWLVRYNNVRFNETNFLFADSNFFDVFSIPMIMGDPHTALQKPNSVVLTQSAALRYFNNESPMGKMLKIEGDSTYYEVTGIVQLPVNSHFQFDFLGSLSTIQYATNQNWLTHNFYTYILFDRDINSNIVTHEINKLVPKYVFPQIEQLTGLSTADFLGSENNLAYFIQPLKKIHLYSNLQLEISKNGDIVTVYIFIFIAILLLVIAGINFMNLTTARSATRAREIALRKVMGSHHGNLVWQFLIESLFFTLIALMVALVIVEIMTPFFQQLINLDISLHSTLNLNFAFFLFIVAIAVGFLAGSYPAWVLASFDPVLTLKQQTKGALHTGKVRNLLVVLQFSASVFILICTLSMNRQIRFVLHRKLGFAKDNVLIIKRSDGLKTNIGAFKDELRKSPNILAVANSTHVPGKVFWKNAFFHQKNPNTTYLFNQSVVSEDYDKVLGLKIIQGRTFSKSNKEDTSSCVINETAAKMIGLSNPVGTKLFQPIGPDRREFTIIGVLKDFNYRSLHYPIEPMIATYMQRNLEGYILVKVSGNQLPESINFIKKTWDKYTSDYIFEYSWLNKDFENLYNSEMRTASIFSTFAILSVFIACLGLFGLIAFNVSQRTKEIGVRKSFGASFGIIIIMITKDTIRLVAFSFLLAWPLAYFILRSWMSNFAYQAGVNIIDYLIAALVVILISVVTISYQAIKAASKNPVDALRYE
jgi:putative ABC transport system permease protein